MKIEFNSINKGIIRLQSPCHSKSISVTSFFDKPFKIMLMTLNTINLNNK